jgi:predicted nucleic acid-binding protein
LILIDTNIFLEAALGQEKSDDCQELLTAISESKIEATVTHFTVHGVAAVLARGQRVLDFFRAIEGSQGLTVYDSSIIDELSIAILSEKISRDFDDTMQYFVAEKIGAEAIVSFDRHFDGLPIPRIEPAQILSES